ncbi:MAG: hypothetical protein JOY58_01145 [Solirubrobacterales bacterium]|nr:hypothetical protein [Solirubrobacterales bacterium]MBV9046842.1 hypothetical protein [Solirubrobacterales bacterium]
MSDSTDLERRYRRLLAFYPQAFRRDHEQEILSVLMAGAVTGQQRPSLAESADLLTNATWMRLRQPTSWEERHHPGLWILVRVLSGIWLVILTGILCRYGSWWGLALLVPAALHFYFALRLGRFIQSQRDAGGP